MTVAGVPHPFAFDRPRFWHDDTDVLRQSGPVWGASILGPRTDNGVIFTNIDITVGPTAARDAEHPTGKVGGPYTSLDDFAVRHLPRRYTIISDTVTHVGAASARDTIYQHVFYGAGYPPPSVLCRSRSLFFEDRGYYYEISYTAADAEYSRYSVVFERMLSTFHFLD